MDTADRIVNMLDDMHGLLERIVETLPKDSYEYIDSQGDLGRIELSLDILKEG